MGEEKKEERRRPSFTDWGREDRIVKMLLFTKKDKEKRSE